jgi:hypothetical protein
MIPSDRVLKHQYCAKNYQCYSELIQDLLQAEMHDELHCLRSIIVQRVKKRWMETNHQRMLINSRKAKETNTRRTNPKTKVQGKERNPSNTTVVVVLIIFQRSAIYPNTWLTCTRNPIKRMKKLKDRMKPTSTLHLMRLQFWANAVMKLQSQA